jgi:hypothetical protein
MLNREYGQFRAFCQIPPFLRSLFFGIINYVNNLNIIYLLPGG